MTVARKHTFKAALSQRVADRIRELSTRGVDDINLIEAVADSFPGISLHDYVGGLALYRAGIGMPGYMLRKVRP